MGSLIAWFTGNKIFSALGGMFRAVVGFFSSTAGLVLVALLFGYYAGHKQAGTATVIAALKSQVSTLQADLRIEKAQHAVAKNQYVSISALLKSNEDKIDALKDLMDKQAKERRVCVLDQSHVNRLRAIK